MTEVSRRTAAVLMSVATKGTRRMALIARLAAYKALSVFGHRNFVRFIVLTRSRTGSNLLLSFLNGHPDIFAEGEIFARMHGRDPMTRLQATFGRQPRHIKAKGFKIFYYHPLDASADELWRQLSILEDIKIIHLTRQNVLRTLLSRKIAGMKDSWTATRFDPVTSEAKRVALTVEELEEGFRQTRDWEDSATIRFRAHPMLQISYEDLVRNPLDAFSSVLAFLGVRNHEPRTNLRHQNPESLHDLIRNYDELKTAFAGSRWAKYFDD